jgi:hypothetical protein
MLVGDAASFVDPLSSYGIKKALASAWLASVCVHSILTNSAVEGAALELFNTRERVMHDALRRAATMLARDAAGSHPTAFWETRSAASSGETQGAFEPDVAALRTDPDVLRALEELRSRDEIHLQLTPTVQRVGRPTVRSNRVVVEDHLVVPAFPGEAQRPGRVEHTSTRLVRRVQQGRVPRTAAGLSGCVVNARGEGLSRVGGIERLVAQTSPIGAFEKAWAKRGMDANSGSYDLPRDVIQFHP